MPPPESRPIQILAIGAHPDDVEISCGGTLALAARQGFAVGILDLTRGELSTNGTVEERAAEAAEAARILGIAERRNAELPDGGINPADPEQVRRVVALLRALRPGILLSHAPVDRHPDHIEASRIVDRAWYLAGLRQFKADGAPHRAEGRYFFASRIVFEPSFIVDVTPVWEEKRRAILVHKTQVERSASSSRPTPLNAPDFIEHIEARARYFGGQIGVRYGEPFRSTEPLGFKTLDALFMSARPEPGSFTA
ncbi:MAG TPA: bacillithiol biosynthesis deacetylase BshB1 [Candidatus Limnocylindrales bacterium]|nr:bacillithiol biosynthesis deacetylase BshB1 [Candidatus Limnocylindrales bacterium]